MQTPQSIVRKARTMLSLDQPFFHALLCHVEEVPTPFVQKFAIDGRHLFYNPEYLQSITPAQVISDLAANVLSCALLHHTRREWRDPEVYDMASDAIVHPIIKEAGFELSPDAFMDPDIKPDMGVEQAYSILIKKATKKPKGGQGDQQGGGSGQQQGKGQQQSKGNGKPDQGDGEADGPSSQPSGSGGSSQVLPPPPQLSEGEGDGGNSMAEQERDWTKAAESAAAAAKGCGNVPACLERLIQQNREPKVDWRAVLRRFFDRTLPHDYSWRPPNRRYVANGDYLPSITKEGYGNLVIAVDTSGSINLEQLAQFCSEINSIISDIKPSSTTVIYCDTQVGNVQEFGPDEYVDLKAVGGGGTSFVGPFKYVEKHDIEPKCLIYLTDMQCDDYPAEPSYPTLWVTDDKKLVAPFGETIRFPVE